MSEYPKYPPCVGPICGVSGCCNGFKSEWPELVGQNGVAAKGIIEKENPAVTVILLVPGERGLTDFCCNRVYLSVDDKGIVQEKPKVG